MNRKKLLLCLFIITLTVVNNCKKVSSETPEVLSAALLINGLDVTNGIVSNLKHSDRLTLKAQIYAPRGIHSVQTAAVFWSHKVGMMNHMEQFHLWDDGTHGDEVPGNGWYCLEDEISVMMFIMGMGWENMMGTHFLEFFCVDDSGNESNHITVNLKIH